ncbi:MAG: aspartate carbamoyltransferase catalytic subunit [Phycisphaerales bacterium]
MAKAARTNKKPARTAPTPPPRPPVRGPVRVHPGVWTHQHLLALQGLDRDEMLALLRRARYFERECPASAASTLSGRIVANLFFEDSTRTRMSFSLAAKRLGAEVVDLSSSDSSVNKGETIRDTAANVAAMGAHAMVIRHRASGAAALVARATGEAFGVCVINAGDGRHEHPTQGLLDAYTIAESFDRLADFDLAGLTIAIVGDVGSSRVARSDIAVMTALGAKVICIGPPGLVPRSLETLGCSVSHELDPLIDKVDAVNVLRIQFERHAAGSKGPGEGRSSDRIGGASLARPNAVASLREYTDLYGLSLRRIDRMKPAAVILHPGPINRGVEMTAAVADGHRSVVLKQVGHGVAVRMAALDLCLSVPRRSVG